MKAGVPHFTCSNEPFGRWIARPKSESLMVELLATIKLSGLMSRWQMPSECKAAIAEHIWRTHRAASASRIARPLSRILSPRSLPSQYSCARYTYTSSSNMSNKRVMFSCAHACIMATSRSTSSRRQPSRLSFAFSICFIATAAPVLLSIARQTVPKEPWPNLTFCRKYLSSMPDAALPISTPRASHRRRRPTERWACTTALNDARCRGCTRT
mmetsp:Transcript_13397/g.38563  ORF Transcript_13397/g.38563 Transcript_13397/m.38563 type:complete len:213 (-) Transcript_13397:3-641(-)